MFTPPNNPSGPSFTPTAVIPHPRRKGTLPQRSSLSNSFSFPSTPPPPIPIHDASFSTDIAFEGDSSIVALPAPTRSRMARQGHQGMAQVSPRVRPSPRSDALNVPTKGDGHRRSRLGDDEPEETKRTSPRKRLAREEEGEEGEERSWDMVDSMRLWRHDAIIQHLYETAAFWGDKILSWTGDPNDAFWLAQTHFLTGHYLRAERLLTEPLPPPPRRPLPRRDSTETELNGFGRRSKGKGRMEEDLVNGHDLDLEDTPRRGKLVDESLACRYLAAQCLVQQEEYHKALGLLGESNPFRESDPSEAQSARRDDGIKLHSSICHLRGLLHLRLSSMALAKESFVEALLIDVKNYEAFRELTEGGMMTSQEEWEFVQRLSYRSQLSEEQSHFVKLMYITKLKKDTHGKEIQNARNELIRSYALEDNCDVLVGLADELYTAYKWEDCYAITSKILNRIPAHQTALPLHLACMHHIHRLRSSLFMLAHDLVEQDPSSATTWYAVGLWYFTGKRWTEARRYFSKANLIDSRFAPAWLAFAHSFAWEGEHDHAITAYSTSARLFPGSHLPLLSIGIEHLQLSSTSLAEEYFLAAQSINKNDPLLLNQLGVVAYNKEDYGLAVQHFRSAITAAKDMQGVPAIWAVTHCNLGHSYRIMGDYDKAHAAYSQSVTLDPSDPTAHTSLAMIAQLRGDVRAAIRGYHTALSLSPQDPMATVLLEMALKEQIDRLDPTTIPGLPFPLSERDLDPFAVPKGNPSFGTLPSENESAEFMAAHSAGTTPLLGLAPRLGVPSNGNTTIDEMSSGRTRGRGRDSVDLMESEMDERHYDESMDVGEGSTMDIEED